MKSLYFVKLTFYFLLNTIRDDDRNYGLLSGYSPYKNTVVL